MGGERKPGVAGMAPPGSAPSGSAIPGQRSQAAGSGRSGSARLSASGAGGGGWSVAPSHRGLPASGAIALALGAGVGGGLVDVLTGSGLRAVFAATFFLGCVLAAALVRRQSLLATVVTPPLAYVALAMAAAAIQHDGSSTSWFLRQVFELLTALITGAPVLISATLAAAVVAGLRVALRRPPGVLRLPPS